MVSISHLKWTSSIVYPMIGQEVRLQEGISTVRFSDSSKVLYNFLESGSDENDLFSEYCENCPELFFATTSAGSNFVVDTIRATHADFSLGHEYGLKEKDQYLFVADSSLYNDDDKTQGAFCDKVTWNFCLENKDFSNVDSSVFKPDPMRPVARALATLMYYPAAPIGMFVFVGCLFGSEDILFCFGQ